MAKRGRKGKYETHVLPNFENIVKWLMHGDTEAVIARKIGVSLSSFNLYKTQYSEFKDVIKKGQQDFDFQVEESLKKRAIGYEYDVAETTIERDEDGFEKKKIRKAKKHVPPDVTADIFWLVNRMPERWKNLRETKISGDVQVRNPLSGLETDELRKALSKLDD